MVLTAYIVLSPATNSSCHRRQRINGRSKARLGSKGLRRLDTSNGCQDHTVLPYAASLPKVSTGHVRPNRNFGEGVKAPFVYAASDRSRENPPCDHACAPDVAASTASRTNVRDDRDTPLWWDGMARGDKDDLPDGESGIFFRRELDALFGVICPTGQKTGIACLVSPVARHWSSNMLWLANGRRQNV